MAISINTNLASLEAQRNLSTTQSRLQVNFQRLSSGLRINSASDDAAGLSISERMAMQISGLAVAERNINNGISLAQTGDGIATQMSSGIDRMRALAVQASSGDLTSTDRAYLNTEYVAMVAEMMRIGDNSTNSPSKFNGTGLFAGTSISFQVGAGTTANDRITLSLEALGPPAFATTTVDTSANAQSSITLLDQCLTTVNTIRENFGSAVNRLQSALASVQSIRTNLTAANSRIRDVDVAEETAALTRNQVLTQAAASVLAQANQMPQIALSLLR